MKRILFTLLAVVTMAVFIERSTRNQFVVVNKSGKVLRTLTIEISGQSYNFENIKPGGETRAFFRISGNEGSFLVRGELDDGSPIDDACGYVVWEEIGKMFTITIAADGSTDCKSN